jgi:hypothetical protein
MTTSQLVCDHDKSTTWGLVKEKHNIECPTLVLCVVVDVSGFCGWGELFCFHTSESTAMAANLWPLSKTKRKGNTYGGFTSLGSWGETQHWVSNFDVMMWRLWEEWQHVLLFVCWAEIKFNSFFSTNTSWKWILHGLMRLHVMTPRITSFTTSHLALLPGG